MYKITQRYATALCAVALCVGCASYSTDESTNDSPTPTPAPVLTTFANTLSQTRTSGEYMGDRVKFYWTSNDELWVNNVATSTLVKSQSSTIPASGGKEEYAKFHVEGTYPEVSYPVRYTGNGNTVGNKVTIKAQQNQDSPNDGAHIGADGDCGTAVATRESDGIHHFMLDHKASYLTFAPYYSAGGGFTSDVKVTQIKVTADEAVAGVYDFDDTGLNLTSPTSTSNSITLTLAGGGTDGFVIPASLDYTQNAAIMVIAPGTYHNFTVEYTLYDRVTKVGGTVSKNYGQVTCNVGKNKRIAPNLEVYHRGGDLYMWDAAEGQSYWQGVSNPPLTSSVAANNNYPKNATDARWYNTASSSTFVSATRSARDLPNINEMVWYAQRGDMRWDADKLWSQYNHLYKAGAWFLKRAYITGYSKDKAPNNVDLRTKNRSEIVSLYGGSAINGTRGTNGNPNDVERYFFLPAEGNTKDGKLFGMIGEGFYWSSTGHADETLAIRLGFTSTWVGVSTMSGRYLGCSLSLME